MYNCLRTARILANGLSPILTTILILIWPSLLLLEGVFDLSTFKRWVSCIFDNKRKKPLTKSNLINNALCLMIHWLIVNCFSTSVIAASSVLFSFHLRQERVTEDLDYFAPHPYGMSVLWTITRKKRMCDRNLVSDSDKVACFFSSSYIVGPWALTVTWVSDAVHWLLVRSTAPS